jgi:polysaccharide export outer membrane protein
VLGGFGVLAALAISCRTARAQDSTSCVVSPASEASSAADTTGRGVGPLHTGDLLKINVFRQKELTGDYLIDNQGRVVIPGLGAIAAAGSVPAAVERRIKALLACRGYQPDVSVQAQIRVSVLGEVRTPGLLTVEPGVKVLQIITLAGGQTPDADLARTRILREGRSYTIDLNTALAGTSNGETGGIVLQSGDVVLVPKRSGFSREDWAFVFSGLATLMTVVNVVVTLSRR